MDGEKTYNNNHPKRADYLDATDSFLGLGHADGLGWIFIRQHLSAAKVVSSKDDPINEILRLTGTWNYAAKQRALVKPCKVP